MLTDLPIPPLDLRKHVGPTEPAAFDNAAGTPIFPDVPLECYDTVLDFGCGSGRIARQLIQQTPRPRVYVGFDLASKVVDWCKAELEPHAPGFTFLHHNVFGPLFNPHPSLPKVLPMPAETGAFRLVIAWSVFTHTVQADAEYYIGECARVLHPDGVALLSFFLFDRRFFPMMHTFQNAIYINLEDPTNAVIFDQDWLQQKLLAAGLGIVHAEPPHVRGHQWLLHIRHLSAGQPVIALPQDHAPFGHIPPPL